MKKLSSYQKLKAENRRLKQDIYDLVMEEDEFKKMDVSFRYRLRFQMIDFAMLGSRKIPCKTGGIFNLIKK